MRAIRSEANWSTLPLVNLTDENGEKIVSFEDESSVLGSKICVFDKDGNQLFFLDEDLTYDYVSFNIQQSGKTIATVKRADSLVHSGIDIESRAGKFDYSPMNGILQRDGKKAAKIIKRTKNNEMQIELYADDEIECVLTLVFVIQILIK